MQIPLWDTFAVQSMKTILLYIILLKTPKEREIHELNFFSCGTRGGGGSMERKISLGGATRYDFFYLVPPGEIFF